jgi:hypothetical protein
MNIATSDTTTITACQSRSRRPKGPLRRREAAKSGGEIRPGLQVTARYAASVSDHSYDDDAAITVVRLAEELVGEDAYGGRGSTERLPSPRLTMRPSRTFASTFRRMLSCFGSCHGRPSPPTSDRHSAASRRAPPGASDPPRNRSAARRRSVRSKSRSMSRSTPMKHS